MSQVMLDMIVPGYSNYPDCFRSCVPYLIASVVHHEKFLRDTLSKDHPLFRCRLFTEGLAARLKPQIVTGISKCPHTNMMATGIPPHLAITTAVEKLGTRIDGLESSLKRSHEEMMASQAQVHDELPRKVVSRLLDNVVVNGAVPLSRQDFIQEFQYFRTHLENHVVNTISTRIQAPSAITNTTAAWTP